MKKATGLGRGLGSLIPNKSTISASIGGETEKLKKGEERIVPIPVDKLSPNPHQPRHDFGEEETTELKASIKEYGVLQPIIVSVVDDGWQIIAGERRWRAAKDLKLKTIPAVVRKVTEQKKMEIAIIENVQRKNLNIMETAEAYKRLQDEFNIPVHELAVRVGRSRPMVSNIMRLLKLPDEAKDAVRDGKISYAGGRALCGLGREDQLMLLGKMLKTKIPTKEVEKMSRKIVLDKKIRPVKFDPDAEAKGEKMQELLGTKVEITKTHGKGYIKIKFFSDEELNNIYKQIIK